MGRDKQYEKAIAKDNSSASFYSNLGAALFSKREFERAGAGRIPEALEMDPDVFGRNVSEPRAGAIAESGRPGAPTITRSPSFTRKSGLPEQSLEYLRKAKEDGYRDPQQRI